MEENITRIDAAITKIENKIEALENRIQSIRFLPEYSDGKVEITSKAAAVDLTFIVSPKEAATKVKQNHVSAYIYRTQSRSVETETPQSLTVTAVSGDATTGKLTVRVTPPNADYWKANKEANIYIQINDGNNDIISEMIPVFYSVICELPEGTTFRTAVHAQMADDTKAIKFIANSAVVTDKQIDNAPAYMELNGTTLEIHTAAQEFVFNSNSGNMFSTLNGYHPKFANITTIDFNGCINTANVTVMARMFYGCQALTSLDLSGFNTAKVSNMIAMFCNCKHLTSLDIRNFNLSQNLLLNQFFDSVGNSLGGAKTNIIVTKELKEKLSTKITIPSTAQYVQLDGVTLWE